MDDRFSFTVIFSYIPTLLDYLPVTLGIFGSAITTGIMLGIFFALVRVYRIPVLRYLVIVFVSYVRGVPLLVQLMLSYCVLPGLLETIGIPGNDLPAIGFVICAYGLHAGVNISEAIRGAIASIPRGQIDAALSLGMTNWQILRRIIFPQAVFIVLPDFCNIMLNGLKSTALAFTVGVGDMVGRGQALGAQTLRNFEVFLALSVIYYVLTVLLESGLKLLENRLLQKRIPKGTTSIS